MTDSLDTSDREACDPREPITLPGADMNENDERDALILKLESVADTLHMEPVTTDDLVTLLREARAALANQRAEAESLAKLGWQAIECPVCGSSARAFPEAANQRAVPPGWKLVASDDHIFNGLCPETPADNSRDPECPACRAMLAAAPAQTTEQTVEQRLRDALEAMGSKKAQSLSAGDLMGVVADIDAQTEQQGSSGVWRSHDANDGMRFPEESDLSGGATDSAQPQAQTEQQSLPTGWVLKIVNGKKWDEFIDAMDRAERKGYLPDALVGPWLQFDYSGVDEFAAQPPERAALKPLTSDQLQSCWSSYRSIAPFQFARAAIAEFCRINGLQQQGEGEP